MSWIDRVLNKQVLHFNFNQCVQSFNNLEKNGKFTIYNNYSQPASLIELNESFRGSQVYRLTFSVKDSNALSSFKNSLGSHGVYNSFSHTYKANTEYVYWIYYRLITHNNARVGGTASNIAGWTEIPSTYIGNGWYRVGQYRNGKVSEDKRDRIFTSFCCSTLALNEEITIDFAAPCLIEGKKEILDSLNYNHSEQIQIIGDSSGNQFHGLLDTNHAPLYKTDSGYGIGYYHFNGQQYIQHKNPFLGQNNKSQEWTVCAWIRLDSNTSSEYMNLNDFNNGLRLCHGGEPLLYLNSGSHDYYTYGKSIPENQWVHIAYVFKNATGLRKIYLNGIDISTSGPNHDNTPRGLSETITVGGNLKGDIADYSIYSIALNSEDIKKLSQVKISIQKTGELITNCIQETPNLFSEDLIIGTCAQNTSPNKDRTKVIIKDKRICLATSAASFYDGKYPGGAKSYSIFPQKYFKTNTSYTIQLTMNCNLISGGKEVPGGFTIYYTDGTSDRTFNVKTSGAWKTITLVTPKNKTIDKIFVYYYTSVLFYVDLTKSFIKENENIQIHKTGVIECNEIYEDWAKTNNNIKTKFFKDGTIKSTEFIEI